MGPGANLEPTQAGVRHERYPSTVGRQQFEFNPGHTGLDEVYGRGRGLREVDDPARLKRTTVIDADHYARAGIEPGYFYHGIEGGVSYGRP